MDPDDFFGRTENNMTERESKNKRREFLEAYEALGPGGLTDDEQHELAELRNLAALERCKIVFDDVKTDDDGDAIINTGNITASAGINTADDIKYFFEKLMKSKLFLPDGDVV
jgi:hypothetical protein